MTPMTEGEALAVEAGLPAYLEAALRKVRNRAEQPRSAVHGQQFIAGLRCAANMIEEAGRRAAHTAASGGEVVGYIVHSADELTRFEATQEAICLGIGRHAVYTAPPAAVPADALERLVEKWRSDRSDYGHYYIKAALSLCASELAALIPKGADHEQR